MGVWVLGGADTLWASIRDFVGVCSLLLSPTLCEECAMHVEMNARLVVVQVTVDDELRWLCTNVAERKPTITWGGCRG